MARTSGGSDDHARVKAKETNALSDGRSGAGSRTLPGVASPRMNPNAAGGGINQPKRKSKLQ